MKWLSRLLGMNPATNHATPEKPSSVMHEKKPAEQALLIHFDSQSLTEEEFLSEDFTRLEEQLAVAVSPIGEFDGHGYGARDELVIYLYGPDAEALFRAVEPHLKAHPLARGAVAIIRKGPPGAPEREVRLA